MLLTADLLLYYRRCNRRAFLEVHGDRHQQDAPSDYLQKILRDSASHREATLSQYEFQNAYPVEGNWKAASQSTLALMRQGVELIRNGGLLIPAGELRFLDPFLAPELTLTLQSSEALFLSQPDLWIKVPGQSQFGNWMYLPLEVKFGRRPKLEYQLVSAFHAWVLGSIQGVLPETAQVLLRQGKCHRVNLPRVMPQLQETVQDCLEMLVSQQEPEVFISRHRCDLCQWLSSCRQVAESQQHLSLIAGVTPTRYETLQALGLTSLESLAGASPELMEPEIESAIATQLVYQAQAVLGQRVIVRSQPFEDDLPVAPVELYFDIEAEPDLELEYLLGVLVVDRLNQTQKFYPFLAEKPEDELQIWQQFLELVWRYPTAPIFHFCDYEFKTVQQLAKRYRTGYAIQSVLSRFVDIHERVTRLVALPIESYALKAIAKWLGFEWRDPSANGAQSIFWYDSWLKTGDRRFLESVIRYNEDDCQATYRVKDWLVNYFNTEV